jgi:hypothetical protein
MSEICDMDAKKLKQIFEMAGYRWKDQLEYIKMMSVPFVGYVDFVVAYVEHDEDYFVLYLKPIQGVAYHGAGKHKRIERHMWRKNVKSLGHPLRAAVIKKYEDVVDLMEFCT